MNEVLEQLEETTNFLNHCVDYEMELEKQSRTDQEAAKHRARAAEYRKHLTKCMKASAKARGLE